MEITHPSTQVFSVEWCHCIFLSDQFPFQFFTWWEYHPHSSPNHSHKEVFSTMQRDCLWNHPIFYSTIRQLCLGYASFESHNLQTESICFFTTVKVISSVSHMIIPGWLKLLLFYHLAFYKIKLLIMSPVAHANYLAILLALGKWIHSFLKPLSCSTGAVCQFLQSDIKSSCNAPHCKSQSNLLVTMLWHLVKNAF